MTPKSITLGAAACLAALGLSAGVAAATELAIVRGPEGEPFSLTFSGGGWGDRTYNLQDENLLSVWTGSYSMTVRFNDGASYTQPLNIQTANGVRNRSRTTTYWCLFVGGDKIIMDSGELCADLVAMHEGYLGE